MTFTPEAAAVFGYLIHHPGSRRIDIIRATELSPYRVARALAVLNGRVIEDHHQISIDHWWTLLPLCEKTQIQGGDVLHCTRE